MAREKQKKRKTTTEPGPEKSKRKKRKPSTPTFAAVLRANGIDDETIDSIRHLRDDMENIVKSTIQPIVNGKDPKVIGNISLKLKRYFQGAIVIGQTKKQRCETCGKRYRDRCTGCSTHEIISTETAADAVDTTGSFDVDVEAASAEEAVVTEDAEQKDDAVVT